MAGNSPNSERFAGTSTTHVDDGSQQEHGRGISDTQMRFREGLVLWLRWNAAYERVSASMFDQRHDPQQLEELMDQMDQLRGRAIALSHKLLN